MVIVHRQIATAPANAFSAISRINDNCSALKTTSANRMKKIGTFKTFISLQQLPILMLGLLKQGE
jgi:hypothetical protein